MAGLLAVLDPAGSLPRATVRGALGEMDYRGPDGRDLLAVDDVRIGHQHFHAAPAARGGRQPVTADGVWLALDGRVDNRVAVRRGLEATPPADCSDAELLLAAYRERGPDVLQRVAGPLGLVVYDADAGRLVVARGKVGLREVFYGWCGDALVVASDRSPILTCLPEPAGVNERRLAEYVENTTYTPGLSVFEGIRKVPPGHYAVVEDGAVTVRRYFRFTGTPSEAGAGELEARLERLVQAVVGARVRSSGDVGTELSGGLDSTTVAAVASGALDEPGAPSAYSLVFSDLGDERLRRDERERTRAVAEMHDLDLTEVPADDLWPLSDPSVYEPFLLESPCVNQMGTAFAALYDRAAADGVRVLLTGEGGNVFDGRQTAYLDLLRRGKVREAVTSMLRDGTSNWRLLWFLLVRLSATLGGRYPDSRSFGRDALLSEAFLARVADEDYDWPAYPQGRFDALVHQDVHRNKLHSYYLDVLNLSRRVALARGVDVRHPFLDPRVVDFAYSLPLELTMRDGRRKVLFRRFAAGYLPERVHSAPTTPSFTPLVTKGLVAERDRVESLLADGELVARGYVAADAVASLLDEFYRTVPDLDAYRNPARVDNVDLWRLVTAERWLRRVADSDRAA